MRVELYKSAERKPAAHNEPSSPASVAVPHINNVNKVGQNTMNGSHAYANMVGQDAKKNLGRGVSSRN